MRTISGLPGRAPVRAMALGLVLGLVGVGCGARLIPLRDQGAVMLPQPVQETEMRAAIARALQARRYTVEQEQPNKVVARLDARGTVLRLNIEYSATQYNIQYLDSQGLNYSVSPQGPMISRSYANYVEGLRRAIQDEIGRPAREAAAAVQAQRDHELAVIEAQRRQQQDVLDAQAAERDRDRMVALEQERLRTATARANADRARAQADANRPIIIGHQATAVVGLRFDARAASGGRGAMRLNPGFTPDPRIVQGTAGGNISAAQLGMPEGCTGFYSGQAAHAIVLAQPFHFLRLETSAPSDTTLAVVAPDGSVWCDDDGAGNQNARIAGEFPAGPYRIYVGNFRQGVISPYELVVSEVDSGPAAMPVAQPVAAPPPPPPPDCRAALLQAGHNAVNLMHCDGAEPHCAVALLQAGHNPVNLIHCRNVESSCAVNLLRAGQNPVNLIHCPRQ